MLFDQKTEPQCDSSLRGNDIPFPLRHPVDKRSDGQIPESFASLSGVVSKNTESPSQADMMSMNLSW
jgi:hypothetical protein